MENYQKLVKKYFLFLLPLGIVFLACGAAFYVLDPLQFFHKSRFMPPDMLSEDMREQAAGIIHNYEFDSIILGTSQTENTSAAEAGQKLGGKFFNLSIQGSSYYERSFPLRLALAKPLKKVIYSLDTDYHACFKDELSVPAEQWTFLYDDNPINDFRRYATRKNLFNLFTKDMGLRKADLDRPNAWFRNPFHYERFGGLEKWVAELDNIQIHDFLTRELPETARLAENAKLVQKHDPAKEQKAKAYINEYLLKYVRENPQTEFYLVFPPYLRYRYARWLRLEPEDFFLHQEVIRYLAAESGKLPNLRVYGFEDQDFLDDISNYKDTIHHKEQINSQILDALASGRHLLTTANVEAYLQSAREKAWKYDIEDLNRQAQSLIQAKGG